MATPSSKSKTDGRPVPVIPPDAPQNANGKPVSSSWNIPIRYTFGRVDFTMYACIMDVWINAPGVYYFISLH